MWASGTLVWALKLNSTGDLDMVNHAKQSNDDDDWQFAWDKLTDNDRCPRRDTTWLLIGLGYIHRTDEDWWGSVWEITERGRRYVEEANGN